MTTRSLKFLRYLPNAFTISSIFCGLYAILLCTTDDQPETIYQAAIAIFFAGFFDAFDGRIARLTKSESAFGVQLDSLADMVSFGVAPGVIIYQWSLSELGFLGYIGAGFFSACCAIRLAKFNVLASNEEGSGNYFSGLPSPLAAAVVIAFITSHYNIFDGEELKYPLIGLSLLILLAALMVSDIKYWSFKKVEKKTQTYYALIGITISFFTLCLIFTPSIILFIYLSLYIISGLLRAILMRD